MTELIPYFILEKNSEAQSNGEFGAFCLFIDIVGFTKLTTKLMAQGTVGAEQLSDILNKLFGPLVDAVYEREGFIPYFAGDAFLAFFEGENTAENLRRCLTLTADIQHHFNTTTDPDIQNIAIKVGMSYGVVEWGICGEDQAAKSYYFRGDAIKCATAAQQMANGGEVVMQAHLVPAGVSWVEALPDRLFVKLQDFPLSNETEKPRRAPKENIQDAQTVSAYLPEPVIDYNLKGEFREVTSVFISFKGVENHAHAKSFFAKVRELSKTFSGYFKEIDYSDKGGVIVVLFGAPVSFENNVERALEFALAIREEQRAGTFADQLFFKMGISEGMCFTGMLGGQHKKQYVALGTQVNLAARLMSYSNWGEIAVTKEVAQEEGFIFDLKGDIYYKGISAAISTYSLVAKSNEGYQFSGQFIGREAEEKSIVEFLTKNTIKNGKPVYLKIYGDAGIGKSRLVHEVAQKIIKEKSVRWHTCRADQILRKPFNPLVYFLSDYFDQNPKYNKIRNQKNFESRLQYFIDGFKQDKDSGNAQALLRFKSVFNALLGFDTRNTLWEELDARAKFNAIIDAVVYIFKTISKKEKLIVEFEDLHWVDESTVAFIKKLIIDVDDSPIAIVCTSRYNDDGSKHKLIDDAFLKFEGFEYMEVDLHQLDDSAIRTYAENKLEGTIGHDFQAFLMRTTNGNPFYLEQILAYLLESELLELDRDGLWAIKDEDISVSSSINSILMARVDRLSEQVKEIVKTAAVIGREFEIPVLNQVMKSNQVFQDVPDSDSVLRKQIKAAEKGQIWSAINELQYIFKHSLLRETLYNMQLRSNLRDLHLLIGEAIEKIYNDNIEPRFVDLAYHFEEAQRHEKAVYYMKKAADTARKNFQNKQALMYYEKVKAYLDQDREKEEYAKILLRESEVLELIGRWNDALSLLRKANTAAIDTKNEILIGRTKNQLGKLLVLKGEYSEAKFILESALKIFTNFNDEIGIFKVQGNLGDLYFRQAEYESARSYFEKSVTLAKEFKDTFTVTQIVSNLGLTYMNQANYDKAIQCQEEQLVLCEERGDRNGMAILNTNIGIVYSEINEHEKAFPYYEKGYKLSHELGNKQMEAIAIGCLGQIYHQRGDYNKALELYLIDLKLCKELGDKRGLSIINGLLAEQLISNGDFARAEEYLEAQLNYSLDLQYQKGITKAYLTKGQLNYYLGKYKEAIKSFDKSIKLSSKIKYLPSMEEASLWKIDTLIAQNELQKVQVIIDHIETFETLEDRNALDLRKIELLGLQQKTKEALELCKAIIPDIRYPKNQAKAYWLLAKLDAQNKQESLDVLQDLYAKMPDYEIKIKIDDLA